MKKKEPLDWYDMPETPYRASQICRILGNPKAYQILLELRRVGSATPSDLSAKVNRTVSTVSGHLKSLRQAHLVRYQREGESAVYCIKNREIEKIMDRLEALVEETRRQDR